MFSESTRIPFEILDGWPASIPHSSVIACEAGSMLGSILLSDTSWQELQDADLWSIRIDHHEVMESNGFIIPTSPVRIPKLAIRQNSTLRDWVMEKHGAIGRLLIWDASQEWWITNDADMELTLICSRPMHFKDDFGEWSARPFEWVDRDYWSDAGIQKVKDLNCRYALGWHP